MKLRPKNQINKSALKIALVVMHAFSLAYSATAIAAGETVSIGSKAGDQNAYASTTWSSLSADGRYTALVASTNYQQGIFLYDRYTGITKSLPFMGIGPELSANSRYVVFRSSATDLVDNDTNGFISDAFLYDTESGKTELISKASDGIQADNESYFAAISNDGQSIVFSSAASNLVNNDTNNAADVFLRQRKSGQTTRLSVSSTGEQGDAGVSNGIVDISGDGRFVVFSSYSNNLVTGDSNSEDIFLHDVKTNVTTRVSQPVRETGFDGGSKHPAISNDGRYIVFYSASSKLVAGDADDLNTDIFVYDRVNKKNIKITNNADGSSIMPGISASGRFVVFVSKASNLVENDSNGTWDTFVYDLQTGKTSRVNVSPQNLQSTGDSMLLMARPSISADGRFIGFESGAKDLTADDSDSAYTDVFLRDTLLNKQKSADIRLTVSAPNAVLKNQQYAYTFNVDNLGPASASQTNVVINLPGSLTVVSLNPSQGSCTKGEVTVCRLGAINKGVKKQIKINVKATVKGSVSVSGSAESVEMDSAYTNNATAKNVTVN